MRLESKRYLLGGSLSGVGGAIAATGASLAMPSVCAAFTVDGSPSPTHAFDQRSSLPRSLGLSTRITPTCIRAAVAQVFT